MNRRLVSILAVLALIIGGAALYMQQREQSARPAVVAQLGRPLLKDLKANEVASIVIRTAKATLTLARKDTRWTLAERHGFAADFGKVGDLVVKAIELKVGQSEPIGEKDRARLDLLDPDKGAHAAEGLATSLKFKAADGRLLAELLIGKKYFKNGPVDDSAHAPADGRFVMLPDHPQQVFIVSDPLRLVSAASADWISKDGFAIERVKSIEVKPFDGDGYSLERSAESAPWKLANAKGGEPLDVSKANAAAYSLGKVEIEDVATNQPAETSPAPPALVTATTFDGLSYTLRIGRLENDRYRLQVEVEGMPKREFEQRKDEKPDAKSAREKSFAAEMSRLQECIAREKDLKNYVLFVAKEKLADLLNTKSELLEQKKKDEKKS